MKSAQTVRDKKNELEAKRPQVWAMMRPSEPANIRENAEHLRVELEAQIDALQWVLEDWRAW
ncbi:MAG TPA: hypothetical protein VKF63_12825 [Terracidiphilus sp.]|nr:hypothetical protein [Terracidiphilus sp.]